MRNHYTPQTAALPLWATPLVTVMLWAAVVVLAVAGVVMLTAHGDAGVFLIVAALVVAAPAAASSHHRSYL